MHFIKRYVKGFYMSLSMFSAVPLRSNLWDNSYMNLMLPCLPLIGALLGLAWWGIAEILVLSGIHIVLVSAVLTTVPFLLTGFLHLDGYMDTSDAILSRRPLEEKLRILKDSHTGAFSVIMLVILFVLQFAAVFAAIDGGKKLMLLIFIAVISRSCASVSLLVLNAMPQSSYANMFKQNTRNIHKAFVVFVAVLMFGAAFWFTGVEGLIVVTFVILGFSGAMAYSYKEFKAASGDLAGFSLVIGELCGLIALSVV